MKHKTGFRGTLLLISLSLLVAQSAAAESEKDFAKCQKMLSKNASWLITKADRARLALDRKVESLISRHVASHPERERDAVRMTAIIDKLLARYEAQGRRKALIDEPADRVLNVENSAKFKCYRQVYIRHALKRTLEHYKDHLRDIEDAVVERLDIEDLAPNEGLVAILFYARGNAQNVDINRLGAIGGSIRFGPIINSDYFRVLKVKAGNYRWHSIWNRTWTGRYTAHLKHSHYDFQVEAGKLNITGAFVFKSSNFRDYSANVFDRTSVVLSLLEDRYPELLSNVEIANGLSSDDRFIEFYLSEKDAARIEDEGA